jgi:hypothetical protein
LIDYVEPVRSGHKILDRHLALRNNGSRLCQAGLAEWHAHDFPHRRILPRDQIQEAIRTKCSRPNLIGKPRNLSPFARRVQQVVGELTAISIGHAHQDEFSILRSIECDLGYAGMRGGITGVCPNAARASVSAANVRLNGIGLLSVNSRSLS